MDQFSFFIKKHTRIIRRRKKTKLRNVKKFLLNKVNLKKHLQVKLNKKIKKHLKHKIYFVRKKEKKEKDILYEMVHVYHPISKKKENPVLKAMAYRQILTDDIMKYRVRMKFNKFLFAKEHRKELTVLDIRRKNKTFRKTKYYLNFRFGGRLTKYLLFDAKYKRDSYSFFRFFFFYKNYFKKIDENFSLLSQFTVNMNLRSVLPSPPRINFIFNTYMNCVETMFHVGSKKLKT